MWSVCRSVSCQQPIKVSPGSSFVLWGERGTAQLGRGLRPRIFCVLTLPPLSIQQPWLFYRPAEICLACEASSRVTQHMHVLYSFLTSAYSGLRLCCAPLWGTEIQDAGMWRLPYMKSCFSDGRCICSLAFLSRRLSVFCRSPRRSGISMLRKIWCLEQTEGLGAETGTEAQGTCLPPSADRCIRGLQW